MEVTFWGTRGSVPCFSKQKIHFGSNTSCLEVKLGGTERLLFDAGTGIVSLGNQLHNGGLIEEETLHLFFSHFHWDHIQGLPFFKMVYHPDARIVIYGRPGVESVFSSQLLGPYSPIPLEALAARIEFVTVEGPLQVGHAKITPFPVNHPQSCLGYVIEAGGVRLTYATDSEPDGGDMDRLLVEHARGADLLIQDSNNTVEEAPHRKGWGHSTWLDCVRTAREAGVRRLALTHHDTFHSDREIRRKERMAQKEFPASFCAYDGLTVGL